MGTGYTRNDTPNNIADGNVINASDLDGEFDAIQAAFNASTGHSHDGTTGEGPQITAAGIANDAVALGTKTTGNYVAAGAVSGVGLSGSASSEGATFTVTSNATSANTASTIVARDASGNFSAGTITASLTGTASNADQLDSLDSTQFLRSDAADTKTSGDLSFSDNVKAIFGAGSDLQIYHNGNDSVVRDAGTGDLLLAGSTNVKITTSGFGETMAEFATNGAATLYYDNSPKLATTSSGIDVTGTVTADGLTVDSSTGITVNGPSSSDGKLNLVAYAGTQNAEARILAARGATSGTDSRLKFYTNNGTSLVQRVDIDDTGDISFYADDGTTQGFFWDASTQRLGLGTTSPTQKLHVDATGSTTAALFDNNGTNGDVVRVGKNGTDILKIRAEGTADLALDASGGSFIFKEGGSEAMRIDSSGNLMASCTATVVNQSSVAGLYYANDSYLAVARSGGAAFIANRLSSDGDAVIFQRQGASVGSIGVEANQLYAVTGDTGIKFAAGSDAYVPVNANGANRDAAISLGVSSVRFKDLYLSSGIYAGSGFGSNGQLLTSNGTTATWQDAPAGGAGYFQGENGVTGDATNGLGDIFRVHEDTLNTNVTIASGNNALCAGPLTIASGVTLTVNGNLSIV